MHYILIATLAFLSTTSSQAAEACIEGPDTTPPLAAEPLSGRPENVLHYIETEVNLMRPASIWVQLPSGRLVCVEGHLTLPTPDERKAALEEKRDPVVRLEGLGRRGETIELRQIQYIVGEAPWSRR